MRDYKKKNTRMYLYHNLCLRFSVLTCILIITLPKTTLTKSMEQQKSTRVQWKIFDKNARGDE